jgi:hypothetical protein
LFRRSGYSPCWSTFAGPGVAAVRRGREDRYRPASSGEDSNANGIADSEDCKIGKIGINGPEILAARSFPVRV